MSQENVEVVRRGHEAFQEAGEEAIFEYLDADIDLTPVAELLDAETYHGHDGVRHWFQTMRDAFGDFGWEPQEFVDVGDHVLVATRFFAEGRGSGVPVEAMIYNLWTVRHGKAVRVFGYLDRSRALEAAGLSEYSVRTRSECRLAREMLRAMSEENVGIVRRHIDAFLAGDPEKARSAYAPDVVFDATLRPDPSPTSRRNVLCVRESEAVWRSHR